MTDSKPKAMSVKLPIDVIESTRIVSAFRGMTMSDLISEILRPALVKMEQEQIAKRSIATAKSKGGK